MAQRHVFAGENGSSVGDLLGQSDGSRIPQSATIRLRPSKGGRYAQPRAVESLDYEIVEDAVYRADQEKRVPMRNVRYVFMKWFCALLVGIITASVAFCINLAVENVSTLKFQWTIDTIQSKSSYVKAFFVYSLFNVVVVGFSACVVTYFAPAAAGSGIPEVKCYLNGIDVPGILLFRTLVGKIIGSVGSVAGGLAVGKEGPLVHTGACVAALLSQGGSKRFKIKGKFLKELKHDRDRRDLVTCGACAGVAAAFRAPVGGVLFAIEEVSSWWRPHLTWRTFFTTAVVSVTIKQLIESCSGGTCGFFGSGGFIIFNINDGQTRYWLYELVPMAILGIIGGLLGSLFNRINGRLCKWRITKLHPRGRHFKVAEAMLVALVTSLFQFCLPLMFPCKACGPEVADCPRPKGVHFGNFVSYHCGDGGGMYNDLATIFFNTQDDAIRNLFSTDQHHEFSPVALVVFLICFFFLAVITYGIAVPSGLFVPSILCGAAYGRLVGMATTAIVGNEDIKEGTYALLGAASFLSGAMRMTVSMCVILLELTNNLDLLPLMMLVLIIAKAVGDSTGTDAIYDLHIKLKQIPLLEERPERFMRHLTALDAASTDVAVFSRVERVRDILNVLQSNDHNGFPVTEEGPDGETNLLGVVLRAHILVVLRKKVSFMASPHEADDGAVGLQYDLLDFTKPVSSRGVDLDDVELTSEECEMYVDLGQFVNTGTYTVQENMSVTKVYELFRSLGLRHLCVVRKPRDVLGVITRKDLLPEHLEEQYPEVHALSRSQSMHSLAEMMPISPSPRKPRVAPPLGSMDGRG